MPPQEASHVSLSNKKSILIILIFICFIILSWSFFKDHYKGDYRKKFLSNIDYIVPDKEFGWVNIKGFRGYAPKRFTGYLTYCRMDSDGNRVSKFEREDNNVNQSENIIWFFGDSSTFGFGVEAEDIYPELLREHYQGKNIQIKNFSVLGYDSAQILKKLKMKLAEGPHKPSLIVLWVGVNNFNPGNLNKIYKITNFSNSFALYKLKKNIEEIVRIAIKNHIPLIINTIPSFDKKPVLSLYNDWLRSIKNDKQKIFINDVAEKFASIHHADLYASIDNLISEHARIIYYIHPSSRGHKIVYQMLLPMVDSILSKDTREISLGQEMVSH